MKLFSFANLRNKRWFLHNSEPELYIIGVVLGILALGLFIGIHSGILSSVIDAYAPFCPLRKTAGLYCPGCGGTRATFALFRGKLLLSLYYYPAVAYAFFVYVWFMVSQTLEWATKGKIRGMQYRNIYLFILLFLILGNWLVKNLILLFLHVALV